MLIIEHYQEYVSYNTIKGTDEPKCWDSQEKRTVFMERDRARQNNEERQKRMKRKKKMKRRRVFWTFIFILIAAVLAFKTVSFARNHNFSELYNLVVTKAVDDSPSEINSESENVTVPNEETEKNTETEKNNEDQSVFKVSEADRWQYILVNKDYPIEKAFGPPETFLVQNNYKADLRIKEPVEEMFRAARADGIELIACSAYRSYDYQTKLFNKRKERYSNLTDEKAAQEAAKAVARPGTSEHQTGLALDIYTPSYTQLDDGFADSEAGMWLKNNAYKYGFILRYPKDKIDLTQIIFEPWHFRYVGKEAAEIMFNEGLCYEEFYERIEFE